ncbi:guanine nucleotide-binding protein G(I)/G(S)/G(O) subunit gamma-T2 isoform X1 [Sciurus carolinensis]|nr:guanine nucleotide-binding protein G(I)/G(S)/G(O) subunit gamma-T2 isoform X1 [Sciurus carolinensis]
MQQQEESGLDTRKMQPEIPGEVFSRLGRVRTRSLRGKMAQDLSEKELLKMEVEQLKKEVKNTRVPISKTGKEIKDYVEAQAGNDPLLKGVPEDKNPFKEKGSCAIS